MESLYRIEELFTTGWELIDESSQRLTKEECKRQLSQYMAEGRNPNTLRVVPENETSS